MLAILLPLLHLVLSLSITPPTLASPANPPPSFLPPPPQTTFPGFTPPCSNRSAWSSIHLPPSTLASALSLLTHPFPEFNQTLYDQYLSTGLRKPGESMLNARSDALASLVLAECVEWQQRFLGTIREALMSLAGQPTWVWPAHVDANGTVDFGSAVLAGLLSMVLVLLGDVLGVEVVKAVREEVKGRVVGPVMDVVEGRREEFWWMEAASNWNAVCFAGVLFAALVVLGADEGERVLEFVVDRSRFFLESFLEDGFAVEGVGYYGFGVGYFGYLREVVRIFTEVTRGDAWMDLFEGEKVEKVVGFPRRFGMRGGAFMPFGDSGGGGVDEALVRYLEWTVWGAGEAPRVAFVKDWNVEMLVLFPERLRQRRGVAGEGGEGKVVETLALRDVFWNASTVVLRDSEVKRKGVEGISRMDVTFKCGGNAGPHSHDDIGAYVVTLDGVVVAGDPGGPRYYTSQTFSSTRYTSPLLNSLGHPVPLFYNSTKTFMQLDAVDVLASHRFKLHANFSDAVDTVSVDLTRAYFRASKVLTRTVTYVRGGEGRVVVLDRVDEGRCKEGVGWETAVVTRGDLGGFGDGGEGWSEEKDEVTGWVGVGEKRVGVTVTAGVGDFFSGRGKGRRAKVKVKMERFEEYGVVFWRVGVRAVVDEEGKEGKKGKVGVLVLYEAM
ncbi:hypothetical protein HDU97_005444 [Phlyctochytrium planicorne]|nr:hypothetical protein HDU97_005444 [Phlyctochytrium planicorne]